MTGAVNNTIPLSKTTKFIVDNRGRTAPTADDGIPLIATNCISNDRLYPSYENVRFVSQATYNTWFRSHPQPGDIILTNKGSQNGAICLVPDPVDFVIAQDMVALRADEKIIDPLFLFAVLRSAEIQREIKNLDVSGVIPHFKKTDFDKLHLPYPERSVQEAIGRTYFDFCAKIELNRRINETLEAMARATFKSWFVDFDPVRAKAEGRDTGLPKHIADLFPDRFEDSELGEIPVGWELGKVEKFATLSRDSINPGDFPKETFEYFSIPAFDEGQTPKRELGAAIKSNKFLIRSDAILLSKLNPRIPRLWLPVVRDNPRAVCSTEFLVVSPRAEASREFIYGFLSSGIFADVFETLVTGTSGSHQRVKPEGLLSMNVVIPCKSVIDYFSKVVRPLLVRMNRAREESQTLAALRDALLPKLISGELRIDTAQKVAEVSA